jgi:alpha-L-rhamnosidase
VRPQPGGGLTWTEAVHDSPLGRLESSWRIDGSRFRLVVTVPPGSSADVVLPDGTTSAQRPGTEEYECAAG